MGRKYIIELPENTHWVQWILESTEDHHPYMDFRHVEDLKPYIEPDLEQVRKEAYEQGRKDVETQFCSYDACKNRQEEYQRGLADAWEAARKIANMIDNERFVVLDTFFVDRAFCKNTAAEAIAKIKAWEDGGQEIKVGDEVENTQTSVRFIVTHLWMNNRGEKGVSGFNYECSAFSTALDLVRKTGRHFPEIATVLKKMRGEQDGKRREE